MIFPLYNMIMLTIHHTNLRDTELSLIEGKIHFCSQRKLYPLTFFPFIFLYT